MDPVTLPQALNSEYSESHYRLDEGWEKQGTNKSRAGVKCGSWVSVWSAARSMKA